MKIWKFCTWGIVWKVSMASTTLDVSLCPFTVVKYPIKQCNLDFRRRIIVLANIKCKGLGDLRPDLGLMRW